MSKQTRIITTLKHINDAYILTALDFVLTNLFYSVLSILRALRKYTILLIKLLIKIIKKTPGKIKTLSILFYNKILRPHTFVCLCLATIICMSSVNLYASSLYAEESQDTMEEEIEYSSNEKTYTVKNAEAEIPESVYTDFTRNVFSTTIEHTYNNFGVQQDLNYPDINLLKISCIASPIRITITYNNLKENYSRYHKTIEAECIRYYNNIAAIKNRYDVLKGLELEIDVCDNGDIQKVYFIINNDGEVDYRTI